MRNHLHSTLAVLLAAIGLAACMTPTPSAVAFSAAPAPDHDTALIYVFRSDPPGSAKLPMINIDRRPIVALQGVEYSAIYVRAGMHTITVDEIDAAPLTFEARGGSVHGLVLEFRTTASQDIYVEAKQGTIPIPQGASPQPRSRPYAWSFIDAVESSNRFGELKERSFKRSVIPNKAEPEPLR